MSNQKERQKQQLFLGAPDHLSNINSDNYYLVPLWKQSLHD